MSRPRQSSFDRLRDLEAVFSLADLQTLYGLDDRTARVYVARWAKKGLVRRFGGGVYFNLVKDENGPSTRLAEALDKLLRVPVVIVGGAAITAGGWTTQVHRKIEIAVPVIRGSLTVPSTEGDVMLTPRYSGWFRKLAASAETGGDGIPVASPEYALADALLANRRSLSAGRPVTVPPPDEIDMGEFDSAALEKVREAMRALGASEAEVNEATAPYEKAVASDASETLSF